MGQNGPRIRHWRIKQDGGSAKWKTEKASYWVKLQSPVIIFQIAPQFLPMSRLIRNLSVKQ